MVNSLILLSYRKQPGLFAETAPCQVFLVPIEYLGFDSWSKGCIHCYSKMAGCHRCLCSVRIELCVLLYLTLFICLQIALDLTLRGVIDSCMARQGTCYIGKARVKENSVGLQQRLTGSSSDVAFSCVTILLEKWIQDHVHEDQKV